MSDDQKPPRPERVHTLCLDYNAFSTEPYINSLLKKIQKVVPSFRVNVVYKAVPLSSLFSTNSKAVIPQKDTSNVVYEFTCDWESTYIGHIGRELVVRMRKHQQYSNGKEVHRHIHTCPIYEKRLNTWIPPQRMTYFQKKFAFFTSHFKILQKSFRSDFERRKTEAFYIRVKRPDLNDQKDHKLYKLF